MEMNSSTHDDRVDLVDDEGECEDEVDVMSHGVHTIMVPNGIDDKPAYEYKKLVVPMSMRSIYWKYFGFPATAEGDILTKVKIVCILCKSQIAYNRNTSNLKMHLQNRHINELQELEAETPPNKPTITPEGREKRAKKKLFRATTSFTANYDGTLQLDPGVDYVAENEVNKFVIKSDPLEERITYLVSDTKSNLSDVITEFLITDLVLPEIVEGRGFQKLIATLKSPCEIPSKNRLEEEIIPKMYENFKDHLCSILGSLNDSVGLAIEEWQSSCGETFFSFVIYYRQSAEPVLESKVLTTIHAESELTETQWGNTIDALLAQWNIGYNRITACTVGSDRRELFEALENRDIPAIPCLLFVMQNCTKVLFEEPSVSSVLSRCRTVIGNILSNSVANATLILQEQMLELENQKNLSLDHPSVWTTTYAMLEQLLARKTIISDVLLSIANAELEEIDISDEQWSVIEDLVNVLEPFRVTVMTLSDEKMPLISLLKPLLWQLVSSHMRIKTSDSALAGKLKKLMSNALCEKYSDPNVSQVLQIATTLDPRFKEVPYATEADKKLVANPIKEMLIKIVEENDNTMDQKPEGLPSKKSRLSGMELLLGQVCGTKREVNPKEKANLEFAQYLSEPTAMLDCCPLQWWKRTSAKCPNLIKIANKYHCIPVCCSAPRKMTGDAQLTFNMKRASLPSRIVDKMLCLHSNQST